MSTTKALCSICQINEFNYTCPKCKNIKYCSLVCYTKHKEIVNNHESPIVVENTITTTSTTINNIKSNINNIIETTQQQESESESNEIESDLESISEDEIQDDNEDYEDSNDNNNNSSRIEPIDNSKVSKFSESLSYYKKVTDQQFKMLDESKYINSVTSHKKLQQLILEVDQQPSDFERIQLLQKYRKRIPEFNEFILKVLATIGNLETLSIDDQGNLINK